MSQYFIEGMVMRTPVAVFSNGSSRTAPPSMSGDAIHTRSTGSAVVMSTATDSTSCGSGIVAARRCEDGMQYEYDCYQTFGHSIYFRVKIRKIFDFRSLPPILWIRIHRRQP